MGDVTEHDFGKRHREAARSFARLAGILEARAEEFLKSPEAFFKEAGDEIVRLKLVIRNASDALRAPVSAYFPDTSGPIPQPPRTIYVPEDEYNRLKACARIVRDAANK